MGIPTVSDIERSRDEVLDWDIVVDDRRRDLNDALAAFCEAVAERERAVARLAVFIADSQGPAVA